MILILNIVHRAMQMFLMGSSVFVIHIHSEQTANWMQFHTLTIVFCFLHDLPIDVYLLTKQTCLFVF